MIINLLIPEPAYATRDETARPCVTWERPAVGRRSLAARHRPQPVLRHAAAESGPADFGGGDGGGHGCRAGVAAGLPGEVGRFVQPRQLSRISEQVDPGGLPVL